MTREAILSSIRRTGALPPVHDPKSRKERDALVIKLLDEGVIAVANKRWFFRGEPAKWGHKEARPLHEPKVNKKQLSIWDVKP